MRFLLIDTALSGILLGVGPLVTIAIAHFVVPRERMTMPKAAGFVVGFCGLVLLLGPCLLTGIGGSELTLLAQLVMVGAASDTRFRGFAPS